MDLLDFGILLLRYYLALASAYVLILRAVPAAQRTLLRYGKSLNVQGSLRKNDIRNLLVPKRRFAHFYVFGSIWSSLALILALHAVTVASFDDSSILQFFDRLLEFKIRFPASIEKLLTIEVAPQSFEITILMLFMMVIQMLRRLYETLVSSPVSASSKMHMFHYFAGILFYFSMPLSIGAEGWKTLRRWREPEDHFDHSLLYEGTVRPRSFVWVTAGLALFFYASIEQHAVHRYLGSLRTQSTALKEPSDITKIAYRLPAGGWFDFIVCPHYWLEILIYASMVMVSGGNNRSVNLSLLWTIVNLAVSADVQYSWYKEKFGEDWKWSKAVKRIVPYIL